jgi:hypothetical protein
MSILFPDSGDLSVLECSSALEAKNRIGLLHSVVCSQSVPNRLADVRQTARLCYPHPPGSRRLARSLQDKSDFEAAVHAFSASLDDA